MDYKVEYRNIQKFVAEKTKEYRQLEEEGIIEHSERVMRLDKLYKNASKESIAYCKKVIERDRALGLKFGELGKGYIRDNIYIVTGRSFEGLEEEVQKRKDKIPEIESYYECLKIEAPYWLDSFKLYIEKDRLRKDRFYEPRRETLKKITSAVQRLEDDELDILFLHLPPRTGKTGDITMDTVWHCSRDTELSNLYVTYKEGLGGAFLQGCVEIITDPTYCYKDVFPKVKIASTDEKNNKLDLGRRKKYKTLSGKGLESGLNGEYDAQGWMIIDDPLEGVQDVMSDEVLKRKQTIFDNNVLSRKKENCKLICEGTLWSTHDIYMNYLDFIENSPEMRNTRYEVIKIPALDPDTDESNFNYTYGGFTTEYYRSLRAKFENNDDMVGWNCQYQQTPIERNGAVFNPEHMNYYSVLPGGEPIKVIAHVDVSLGGGDFLSMPIVYYYEGEDGDLVGYVEDVVFDNSEKHITQPQIIAKIKKHIIKHLHFESNAGGELYADDIKRMLKEDRNYREICNISSDYAPVTKKKQQRIWDNAEEIRKLYFKDPQHRDVQYRKFMNNLFSFSMNMSKRSHDDSPDSLSGLIDFEKHGTGVKVARIIRSPI